MTPLNGIMEPDFLEYLDKTFKRWQQLADQGVTLGSREIAKLTDTVYGARLNARYGFEAITHRGPGMKRARSVLPLVLQKPGSSGNRRAALYL